MERKVSMRTACVRCGICCSKGGPALHDEDLVLLKSGVLPLTALYTIRKGELALDNVRGGRIRMPSEIIKIKTLSGSPACMYFDKMNQRCGIYERRPWECRELECWNPGVLENIYTIRRLTREAVLKNIPWLLELVAAHESECAMDIVDGLVKRRAAGDLSAAAGLESRVHYDLHYRRLAMEKGHLPPDMLGFLFGQPLADIIPRQFGVKFKHDGLVKSQKTCCPVVPVQAGIQYIR